MKASIELLEEYSNIDKTAQELGDILTLTGSKVEGVESKGGDIKNVVVGKILEVTKHPDADKLVITKVDVGNGEILQIVTAAQNIKVGTSGQIVPVAKDGAKLPGGVKINTGKLRGIESQGMMCGMEELEIDPANYPDKVVDGIFILDDEYEKNIGEDIVKVLDLKEDIIEFEITPNRPDCLSIEGLGRETAVSLKQEFKNPRADLQNMKVEAKEELEGLKVKIEAPDLCYRYVARVVKNVKIGPSPKWMVRRLNACGVKSINNIVDITNYVMLELGQPMHAFDIKTIDGKNIIVRRAGANENITTLDGIERTLDESMLVIADNKKAIGIAGVMGGENSEITNDTQTLVLESAVFYGGNIRKTAKKVGLRTEASSRYEKGLSPENSERVVNRAVQLIEELQIGTAVDGIIDIYPNKQKVNTIKLDVNRINNLLGTNVTREEMINILTKLDVKVEGDTLIPPYYRQDLEGIADIAEEIIRFYGYDKLETTLVKAETTLGGRNKKQTIVNDLRNLLINSGLSEIYTYGFICEKDLDKMNLPKEDILRKQSIKISNPLSEDYTIMRTSTVPSMMETLETNYNKKNRNVKLYDISRSYKDELNEVEENKLPKEELILTIGEYGDDVDFYTLKGLIENILEVAGVQRYNIEKELENRIYHPGRTANLKIGNDIIVTFGEIHPVVANNYEIKDRVYIAEINLEKIARYAKINKKYVEIPKYPAVERDLAILVDESVTAGEIENIITKKAKKNLEELKLFDIYRDEKIGVNQKSIAYSLKFRDKNKTMSDEEINPIMEQIIKELEEKLNAKLRK